MNHLRTIHYEFNMKNYEKYNILIKCNKKAKKEDSQLRGKTQGMHGAKM